jgi:hypothetical protein
MNWRTGSRIQETRGPSDFSFYMKAQNGIKLKNFHLILQKLTLCAVVTFKKIQASTYEFVLVGSGILEVMNNRSWSIPDLSRNNSYLSWSLRPRTNYNPRQFSGLRLDFMVITSLFLDASLSLVKQNDRNHGE